MENYGEPKIFMGLLERVSRDAEDIVFVYTICSNKEEARMMGLLAIEEKLAISMDYWVINSIYPWQGVIEEVDQYLLMFSTQKQKSEELMKHIESKHSYKVPMITKCNTDMANMPYQLWVDDTLKNTDKYKTEEDAYPIEDINSLHNLK